MRRHARRDRRWPTADACHRGRQRRGRRGAGRRSRLSSLSDPVAFAGGDLDRAAPRRFDEAWLEQARGHDGALAVLVGRGGTSAGPVALGDAEPTVLLGVRDDGTPVWLAAARDGDELVDLRTLAARVDGATAGLVAQASAMAHFHRAARFCGFCGEPTQAGEGGWVRTCANGHQQHPRTDPVVIMLVVDGDGRALMGRQPSWPRRRYSALAGFVEPGEGLEAAVAREVAEEASVRVGAVRFVTSQPWPFPASLMLGFLAEYESGDAAIGDEELESVRWFDRAEVAEADREDLDFTDGAGDTGEGLVLPPRIAIARRLIEVWLAGARPV